MSFQVIHAIRRSQWIKLFEIADQRSTSQAYDHNSVNLGIIKMKQKLKCNKWFCYVATAMKIRLHFQFPWSPDAAFGGPIGCLFNWECKSSCRIISNIADYLKYNYFWDCHGIDKVTLRLWKFSDFCSRHTVGVAGDNIMFHILVKLKVCLVGLVWELFSSNPQNIVQTNHIGVITYDRYCHCHAAVCPLRDTIKHFRDTLYW